MPYHSRSWFLFCYKKTNLGKRRILCMLQIKLLLLIREAAKVKQAFLIVSKNLEMLRSQRRKTKMRRKVKSRKCFASTVRQTIMLSRRVLRLLRKRLRRKRLVWLVANASPSSTESINVVQDIDWAFNAQCNYDPLLHDSCMSVVDSDVWYFDSGTTKHITSQRSLFTYLESAPKGNTVTCANNSLYPIEGVGQIVLIATNGTTFTLYDALYVTGIKKNLLSVFALAKIGLVVKFVDDRCTVHDLSYGDIIVASGTLC